MPQLITALLCVACVVVGAVVGMAIAKRRQQTSAPAVFKLLYAHFWPTQLDSITVTERQFPSRVRVDLQRSLDDFFKQHAQMTHVCGVRHQDSMMFGLSLSEFLTQQTQAFTVPLEFEEVDIGEENPVRCVRNGLWLAAAPNLKLAILESQVMGFRDPPKVRFDVATDNSPAGAELSRCFFRMLEKAVQDAQSYRGKVLSLQTAEGYTGQSSGITVHSLLTVARDDLILPEGTVSLLDRNVLEFVAQCPRLAQLAQSTKKGLLFYGPPGNGKTHTIRYLISQLKGHTTLLITGEQVGQLSEYMALARLLQPTIVVLEDVDLVARAREESGSPCQESLLNRLLNEMDGLTEETQVVFLLTTNRPAQLEEALASRPGRIDQAIEFPYPDEVGRMKLAKLYSKSVAIDDETIAEVVRRTAGASAAFIKELMRRAIQSHLAHGASENVEQRDVAAALDELLISGGPLNPRLLGAGRCNNAETLDAQVPR